MSDESKALAVQNFMPVFSITEVIERRNLVVEFVKQAMKEGVDYGKIPGTDKNTLLKPGAEKLCNLFGLTPIFELESDSIFDWTGEAHNGEPLINFGYLCKLYRGDALIASASGSCSSWEKKYRYRQAQRVCPNCGKDTIIKGKEEYGGGWICFTKKGGCGKKYLDNDPLILGQETGQVINPDIFDQVNTLKKMAQKRALVASTLIAVNASEFFTQDMEDWAIEVESKVVETDKPASVSQPPAPARSQERVATHEEIVAQTTDAPRIAPFPASMGKGTDVPSKPIAEQPQPQPSQSESKPARPRPPRPFEPDDLRVMVAETAHWFASKGVEMTAGQRGAVVGKLDEVCGGADYRHTFILWLSPESSGSTKSLDDAMMSALGRWSADAVNAEKEAAKVFSLVVTEKGQAELFSKNVV